MKWVTQIEILGQCVADFHERFGQGRSEEGESLTDLRNEYTKRHIGGFLQDRFMFLAEEVGEAARGLNHDDLENHLDEIADIAYFALGTLHRMGDLGEDALERTIMKNDAKTLETHEFEALSGKIVRKKARTAP